MWVGGLCWRKQPYPPEDALAAEVKHTMATQRSPPKCALASKEDGMVKTQDSLRDTQRAEEPLLTQPEPFDESQGSKVA